MNTFINTLCEHHNFGTSGMKCIVCGYELLKYPYIGGIAKEDKIKVMGSKPSNRYAEATMTKENITLRLKSKIDEFINQKGIYPNLLLIDDESLLELQAEYGKTITKQTTIYGLEIIYISKVDGFSVAYSLDKIKTKGGRLTWLKRRLIH